MSPPKKSPKVANRLKYFRRLCGYTQEEVAALIEVNPVQISDWEKGKKQPSLTNAFKLAKAYYRYTEHLFPELNSEIEQRINIKFQQRYEQSIKK